jgi:hypothetical protein
MSGGSPLAGQEEVQTLLHDAGLDCPPIPGELASRFARRADWCFSTRPVDHSPYDLEHYVTESRQPLSDYVLIAHAGHGVNSYAIHYYLVRGRLRLFLQLGWGGIYMDKAASTEAANGCIRRARKLVEAAQGVVLGGRLLSQQQLVVVGSDFYGGFCALPGEPQPDRRSWGASGKRSVADVIDRAIRWCTSGEGSVGQQHDPAGY